MKRSLVIALLTIVGGLMSACTSLNPAYRLGTVSTVSGSDLQVCSGPKDTPPIAGQAVQLLRREQFGNPKFAPTFRERRVGTAEIGTSVSGRCVEARLVQGKARRYDQVFPALGDATPK
ncbi:MULTISPECIES: hypothetical protein [Stenotrophomonas]|jgi:hypothetical protein|uniref:Lipoprotein n=1 Tax=Stenotrophomonas aracearum TaxID=3003272 RepID=A0ABY9YHY5_9GAMM|nr:MULTISPECIES: hypothetical protein [unclassified Stenotrophomonas]MBW8373142.1 hypothetical protein [Stenotrophomonas sp.]WNH50473.1 hypothetical protein PDM28_09345 [Stenotrophomonas sp. A5588]